MKALILILLAFIPQLSLGNTFTMDRPAFPCAGWNSYHLQTPAGETNDGLFYVSVEAHGGKVGVEPHMFALTRGYYANFLVRPEAPGIHFRVIVKDVYGKIVSNTEAISK